MRVSKTYRLFIKYFHYRQMFNGYYSAPVDIAYLFKGIPADNSHLSAEDLQIYGSTGSVRMEIYAHGKEWWRNITVS